MDTRHFALLGYPLEHSFSKRCFDAQRIPEADYSLCAMPRLPDLHRWAEERGMSGFNVTSPFKTEAARQMDTLSDTAAETGAVNCVVVDGGRLAGHNTDAPAFASTLRGWMGSLGRPMPSIAVVMGTGGAAQAVSHALRSLGVSHCLASRTPQARPGSTGYGEARELLRLHGDALLVNATPAGTSPRSETSAWPWPDELRAGMAVYDLVYNPSPTLLMKEASARGADVCGGLAMLEEQARISRVLWGLEQG